MTFRNETAGFKIREDQETSQNVMVKFDYGGKITRSTKNVINKENVKRKQYGHPLDILVGQNGKCLSKQVLIANIPHESHVFIQLDKPIYKPRDEIKFRIIAFDGDTKGIGINNIEVIIRDADGNSLKKFDQLEKQTFKNKGLYEDTFIIAEEVNLGNWKISAKINNNDEIYGEKYFPVEKVSIPFFEVKIEVPEVAYKTDKKFDVTISGVYRFGEYAKGKAIISVKNYDNPSSPSELFTDNINVDAKVTKSLRFLEDLKIRIIHNDYVTLQIVVMYADDATDIKKNSSKLMKVYLKREHQIIIKKHFSYTPGLTFKIDVLIKDSNGLTLTSSAQPVELNYQAVASTKKGTKVVKLSRGVASFEIETFKNDKAVDIEVKYLQAHKKERIREEAELKITDSLRVFVIPKR